MDPNPTSEGTIVLTGLTSRGGLSNWVFFFFPAEIVQCDLGIMPAVKAGAVAGIRANLDVVGEIGETTYGPRGPKGGSAEAWCDELVGKAKRVERLPCEHVRGIRLHLTAMAHELYVTADEDKPRMFSLMNRSEAGEVRGLLEARFGQRFVVTKSAVFAFFERHAPFLMR
ncbi:hypothetical protein [Polyangium jinanense]|uniref:Uncharacterized protein n=1 Tax=Polyangium jinanense TaxID=2829994 RepID=A0A9X4AXW4_9BACT|nr:hypothetical protein [Polyangium jinanense]MDC3959594.1 hypothetical protein [Polyangium jinanense]MDC3986557.1 hypothetical protein [Polyangium jinanense]